MLRYRSDRRGPFKPSRQAAAWLVGVGVAVSLVSGAAGLGQTGDSECVPNAKDGSCLPIAAESERVDLSEPSFSDPTNITNSLFPISELASVVMLGEVDGLPFRTEVTLLAETKTIEWNGQPVETLVSQYAAYLDGRLHEVALDWYAQADDGSVWYFGEDVFNYEDGVVADTHGTWIAGPEQPAGMIMPASPRVGDVYRPENIPGLVFEEVTVTATGVTVDGPHGPVPGAIVVSELHDDGSTEEKTFAPGYGEFLTGGGGDLEAVALAVPTDALPGPPPAELVTLETGAAEILESVPAGNWNEAAASVESITAAWETYRAEDVPAMIESEMDSALDALTTAVAARDGAGTSQAAIDVAQAGLDLQLRYQPVPEIDLARLDLQARQLLLDVTAGDSGAVAGDVATLDWIWDRVAHTLAPTTAGPIEDQMADLRAAAAAGELDATAASELLELLPAATGSG